MTTDPTPAGLNPRAVQLNAVAGSLVVAVGFWLLWGQLPIPVVAVLALAAAVFLVWKGRSIARLWAWATLLLGLESFAWPVMTMVRIRLETAEPTDQHMADILTSLLFGLFAAIFWTSFSYGLFNWARRQEAAGATPGGPDAPPDRGGKKPRSPA